VLLGRGLCDELITRPKESYRLRCVVMRDLETSRIGAPYIHIYIYIYDISNLRVKPRSSVTRTSNHNPVPLTTLCLSQADAIKQE